MPKRVNNIFKKAITFRKLLEAHNKTKKGKRFKKQVIEFEMDLESNIIQIEKQLLNGTYKFSKYFEFRIYEPKERIIKTLKYRDRVVQTWYVENFLKPYFAVSFISDSFACIEGKGTHKAVDQMQIYLKKADREYKDVWVLKCDISKFFFNIDCEILYKIIEKKIKDKDFLDFTKNILYSENETGISIPIGNYTSQFYANIYMNELDKYVKEVLKIKYIERYMDDFVLILKSKQEAKDILDKITVFLDINLHLKLNQKTAYFKASQGVNFCGYRIWKTHKLFRNQSKKKIKRKLKNFENLYKEDRIELDYILACINSWRGHASHCNSYNFQKKLFEEFALKK